MRPQKVSVNVWQMIYSSCTYLALAFICWLFLKLVHACFWLPGYLKRQDAEQESAAYEEIAEEPDENTNKKEK